MRILPAVLLAALLLSGCQTTAEKSAALAKKFHRETILEHGLSITRTNREVKVLDTALVHDENGTAAAVTLRNEGSRALREVPIKITLRAPSTGRVIYQNIAAGLDPSLTSLSLLLPHQTLTWVDDQVPGSAFPASILARVGEARFSTSAPPRLDAQAVHLVQDPANGTVAQGTMVNHSTLTQQNLAVLAVARRGGKVVAAGRALVSTVPAGGSSPFQIFFIGNPSASTLEVSAPARTLG